MTIVPCSTWGRSCCGVIVDGRFHVDVPNLNAEDISCDEECYFNLFSLHVTSRNEGRL